MRMGNGLQWNCHVQVKSFVPFKVMFNELYNVYTWFIIKYSSLLPNKVEAVSVKMYIDYSV